MEAGTPTPKAEMVARVQKQEAEEEEDKAFQALLMLEVLAEVLQLVLPGPLQVTIHRPEASGETADLAAAGEAVAAAVLVCPQAQEAAMAATAVPASFWLSY